MTAKKILGLALGFLSAAGCAGPARFLVVRSEPADAQVCIKGRSTTDYFSPEKSCVGTTPFENDRVELTDAKGRKRVIKFKDVERAGERFYIVVTHKGYEAQAVEVPDWEHLVVLRPVK